MTTMLISLVVMWTAIPTMWFALITGNDNLWLKSATVIIASGITWFIGAKRERLL